MEVNDEQFWESLRRTVKRAEADQDNDFDAAERLLAETDVDPEQRLSEERIDDMVERAMLDRVSENEAAENDATENAASEPAEVDSASPQPAPIRKLRRLPPVFATAAAMMVAPKFLVAATALTVVAATAYVLRYSTQTLPFQDAVIILMDEEQVEQSRRTAQGRVFFDVVESIGVLHSVALEDTALASEATAAIDRLRLVLAGNEPFVPVQFDDPHMWLGDQAMAADLDVGQRQDALAQLVLQVAYGIRALQAVQQGAVPPGLMSDNEVHLMRIASLLD